MASILEEKYAPSLWLMAQQRTMHSDFPPRLHNTTSFNFTNRSGLPAILPLSIPNAIMNNVEAANYRIAQNFDGGKV